MEKQNINEAMNSIIWKILPKIIFVWRILLEIGKWYTYHFVKLTYSCRIFHINDILQVRVDRKRRRKLCVIWNGFQDKSKAIEGEAYVRGKLECCLLIHTFCSISYTSLLPIVQYILTHVTHVIQLYILCIQPPSKDVSFCVSIISEFVAHECTRYMKCVHKNKNKYICVFKNCKQNYL